MRCEQIQDLLPLYAGQDLGADHQKMVGEHLASCNECTQEWREYAEPQAALSSLKEGTVPGRVWQDMWKGIQSELQFSRKDSRVLFFDSLSRAAAALLIGLGLGFVGYVVMADRSDPVTVANVRVGDESFRAASPEQPVREIIADVGDHVVVKVTSITPQGSTQEEKFHAPNLSEFQKLYPDLYDQCSSLFNRGAGRYINISPDGQTVTLVNTEVLKDSGAVRSTGSQFKPRNTREFIDSCVENWGQWNRWGRTPRAPAPEKKSEQK